MDDEEDEITQIMEERKITSSENAIAIWSTQKLFKFVSQDDCKFYFSRIICAKRDG